MAAGAGPADFIRRFLFEDLALRGALVRLGPAWRALHQGRGYPAPVRRLLGEMTAVTVLMGGNLKQPGRLTVQIQGHGPLRLAVIDVSSELGIRGTAHHEPHLAEAPLAQLLGDGRLVLTLQADGAREPYQSLVPLAGDCVAAVFEHFLTQSEQLPARLWLTADEHAAAGLFLQKLPGADERDTDGWNRVLQLAATVQPEELADTPVVGLLTRLFADETLRLFDPRLVTYDCPEDRGKIRRLLRSLGRDEVESILAEQGEVRIHDDICNRDYRFSAAEVAEVFAAAADETPR